MLYLRGSFEIQTTGKVPLNHWVLIKKKDLYPNDYFTIDIWVYLIKYHQASIGFTVQLYSFISAQMLLSSNGSTFNLCPSAGMIVDNFSKPPAFWRLLLRDLCCQTTERDVKTHNTPRVSPQDQLKDSSAGRWLSTSVCVCLSCDAIAS